MYEQIWQLTAFKHVLEMLRVDLLANACFCRRFQGQQSLESTAGFPKRRLWADKMLITSYRHIKTNQWGCMIIRAIIKVSDLIQYLHILCSCCQLMIRCFHRLTVNALNSITVWEFNMHQETQYVLALLIHSQHFGEQKFAVFYKYHYYY